MKFFAPANNWDMTSSESWWPLIGSVQTSSGIAVTSESALRCGPAFAATRVITETMASLPCAIKQRTDDRSSRNATDHKLWQIVHNAPTPEQDKMSWFDMQVGYQVLCGNAFAEIQRDTVGNIVALWPIHPSRLPRCNIRKNPTDPRFYDNIIAGKPGEWVFYVRNDDGTVTPIPASDMFHVPGVCLNSRDILGRGIPEFAADALGVAIATDKHAAAFFKNGAVSNIVIKSTKTVGKETADRLREQWQKTFGGVHNHYKTLLLEEGMEPEAFSVDPEKSQLMLARQFNTTDVVRFWRVQPHLIGDLSRATFSNIEQQALEFIKFTMLPWVTRWECAMWRQLLTPAEQKTYYFKFNLLVLLRGDSDALAKFYKALFDMGVYSPNDINELEDRNPVQGGDQRFIPANNLFPLEKAGEMAQAQIDKLTAPPPAPPQTAQPDDDSDVEDRMRDFIAKVELRDTYDAEQVAIRQQRVLDSEERVRTALRAAIAARVVGLMEYEVRAIKQATRKPETFLSWQGDFYAEFRGKMTEALSPFSEAASGLGFDFLPSECADDYIGDSLTWLAPLADVPCAGLESAALEELAKWTVRPLRLARSIIPERVELCAA